MVKSTASGTGKYPLICVGGLKAILGVAFGRDFNDRRH